MSHSVCHTLYVTLCMSHSVFGHTVPGNWFSWELIFPGAHFPGSHFPGFQEVIFPVGPRANLYENADANYGTFRKCVTDNNRLVYRFIHLNHEYKPNLDHWFNYLRRQHEPVKTGMNACKWIVDWKGIISEINSSGLPWQCSLGWPDFLIQIKCTFDNNLSLCNVLHTKAPWELSFFC